MRASRFIGFLRPHSCRPWYQRGHRLRGSLDLQATCCCWCGPSVSMHSVFWMCHISSMKLCCSFSRCWGKATLYVFLARHAAQLCRYAPFHAMLQLFTMLEPSNFTCISCQGKDRHAAQLFRYTYFMQIAFSLLMGLLCWGSGSPKAA